MTVQPTQDQLRALAARAADDGYTGNDDFGHLTVSPAVLVAVLDQLDQAEADVKRLSWSNGHLADKYAADMEELRQDLDQAEARIKAVEDVLDKHESILGDNLGVPVDRIRRALNG